MGIRFNARTNSIETDAASVDFTQPITTPASTASLAGLNIAEGVAPSAPVDGDVWVTAGGNFNARLNGVTVDLAAGGGGDVTKVGTPVNNQIGVWTGDGTIEGDANLVWDGTAHELTLSDGTDSILMQIVLNTFDIGGSGLNSIRLQPTNGQNSVVANAGGSVVLSYNNTPTFQTNINRSESLNAITSNSGGVERVLTVGDIEAGQPRLRYFFDATTTSGDPGSGQIRYNNATPASVTSLYINDTSDSGLNSDRVLNNLASGDILTLCDEQDGADYLVVSVNGAPTDNTGWWTIPVTVIHSGTLPTNVVNIDVQWFSQAGGGGNVSNTGTPVNNQLAIWTDATTIEGDAQLTYDGAALAVYGDQTASLIDALDETFYDNSPTTEGTFSGGTGYAAAEVITLSDGSTITVDAVSGGVVTEFTVETVTTTPFVLGSTLTTTSSTGAGNDDFTLTPDIDNVTLTVSNHYIGNRTDNRIGFEQGDNYAQISLEDADAVSTKATFTFDTNGSGAVSGITVTGAGAGYSGSSFQFNITVASDAGFVPGTEAIITATVLGGKVVSAVVTLAGSGYTINLTGSSVAAADVDDPNLACNFWFDITSNSTGAHQFLFSDGGYGGAGAVFNLTKQNYFFGGGIDLLEVADHKGDNEDGSVGTGVGQIWVKQRSGGGELMFTEGDNDTDYTVQNLIPSTYNFDSSTASADPGAGDFRFDNATPASVTNIYVNDAEHTGRDNAFQLGNLAYGDIIKMRSPYFNRHWIGRVDGTPTDNTGWWTIPVAHIDSSSLFVANNPVQIEIDSLSQTPSVYTALKTSTTSRNTTTTLADDPDLSVTVVEPGYYMVEVCFIWGNVTTTTQGFRFVLVGGTGHGIAHYRTAAVPSASAEFGTLSSTTSVHTNIPSAGTNTPMVGSGFRDITSANTTFKLQWAQGVSNANATELRAGSFIRLTRLGDT